VTIDSNWRWLHQDGQAKNCYTGNQWDKTLCPTPEECGTNCVVEGADEEYAGTYGITATDDSLDLKFVTQGPSSKNVGSRTYLLDSEDKYMMFKLKNSEFTFDVDVSNLPCGLNGALYFVQMDADGGASKFPEKNTAGAKYGTGYCDAQCPHDLKYINGEPNMLDWQPSPTDPNSGIGRYGTCCVEMDIWEANKMSTAFTPHACTVKEQTRCGGDGGPSCGDNPSHRFDGVCDKNGCDFQTYRLGNTSFFGEGPSFTIDTTKKITVVTQFVTEDGTDNGKLTEIRRHYEQGGKVVPTPSLMVGGKGPFSSVSTEYCQAEVDLFADRTNFLDKGGMGAMDAAFETGMVLVMSLWDDHSVDMLWLDSTYPVGGTKPGDKRGSCATSSGDPKVVEAQSPNAHVAYSNIRFGEIGSTGAGVVPGPSPSPSPPPPPPPGEGYSCKHKKRHPTCKKDRLSTKSKASCEAACQKEAPNPHAPMVEVEETAAAHCPTKPWMQCDGRGFAGDFCCPTGWECAERTAAFHQCVPSRALAEAFVHTQPTPAMIDDFLGSGKTLFPASGLTPYAAAAQPAAQPAARTTWVA